MQPEDRTRQVRLLLMDVLENPDLEDEDRAALLEVLELIDSPAHSDAERLYLIRQHFPALYASLAIEPAEDV